MKKKLLTLILAFAMMIAFAGVAMAAETVVYTAQDLYDALAESEQDASAYIKLGNDIIFDTSILGTNYYAVNYFAGTLDGDGHKLTIINTTEDWHALIGYPYYTATIKNLDLEHQGSIVSPLAFQVIDVTDGANDGNIVTFENINVVDNEDVILDLGSNGSPLVCHIAGDFIMKNCNNYEQYNGTGYEGIFVGGMILCKGEVTFENCNNYGDLKGEAVGLLSGNPYIEQNGAYYTPDITVINCNNYGTITGTTSANVFCTNNGSTNYDAMNTEYPIDSINSTIEIDGVTYTGTIAIVDPAYVISGAVSGTGVISINDINEVVEATGYGVQIWHYAYSEETGGTWVNGVLIKADTLTEFDNLGIRYGTLIDTKTFKSLYPDEVTYTPSWDLDCDDALNGMEYEIAVIGNTLYYVIDIVGNNDTYYTINTSSPRVDVKAYNELGTQIASVTLTAPTITVPSIAAAVDGVAYFTFAEAFDVAENANLTILESATLSESYTIAEGTTLTVAEGATLTIDTGKTLTVEGTLINNGAIINNGTIATAEGKSVDTAVDEFLDETTTDTLLNNEETLEEFNALDELFIAANTNLDVEATITPVDDEDYTIDSVTVAGLGLAVYGDGLTEIATGTVLTLKVEQTTSTDDVDFAFSATPYVKVGDTAEEQIANDKLNTPVTFTITLPNTFEAELVKVAHYESGSTTLIETMILPVLTDDEGNKYIQITVTEFSDFTVTEYKYSVSYTYYDITLTTTGEGTITPTGGDNATITTAKGGSRMFTFTPAAGYEIADVIVDGDSVGAVDTYYFASISADHTLEVVFATEDGSVDNSLNAMDEDAYYYNAIQWAIEEGMIDEADETLTTIVDGSTRAESVYFMWIAYGSPVVDIENPFTDIDTDDYYYNAVLWAYSVDITAGTTTTTFAPEDVCTRAQIASFIHRAEGEPVVESDNDFTDLVDGAYYANAINWAVSEEIVAGMTTSTFEPSTDCARTHILTFLYRYCI